MKRRSIGFLSSVLIATAALAAAGLDDGLLVPDWFPGAGEFRETESFDYLWVKDGFTFTGRTVHVKDWEGPVWLYEKRDVKDRTKGEELTELMPTRLRGALKATLEGKATVSREEGDLLLLGRFVDVNAGGKGAKWLEEFAPAAAAGFREYAGGKPRKK